MKDKLRGACLFLTVGLKFYFPLRGEKGGEIVKITNLFACLIYFGMQIVQPSDCYTCQLCFERCDINVLKVSVSLRVIHVADQPSCKSEVVRVFTFTC